MRNIVLGILLLAVPVFAATPVRVVKDERPPIELKVRVVEESGAVEATAGVNILGLANYGDNMSSWAKDANPVLKPFAVVLDATVWAFRETPVQATAATLAVMLAANAFGFQDWTKDTLKMGSSGDGGSDEQPDQQSTSSSGDAVNVNVSGSGNTINVNTGDSTESTTAMLQRRLYEFDNDYELLTNPHLEIALRIMQERDENMTLAKMQAATRLSLASK